ncbi:transcriptional regulator [Microbacterium sp. Root61]|uniref:IclR family transcriptional regulator n=1 Tax=Microbacterium sp. Root61 TaxID=1736570 RepID=UPI0006F7C8A5|nr:IclR family transcriptional regulator [Microbacterium sp. Root61]KRA25472.1 transcriptional regulator [Microbacterium sp. Root61]
MADDTSGEGLLSRAMRMLRAFSEDDERLTAAELAVRTGLPRSTAHRLAGEMMALGMLDRLPDGAYTIGTGLWEVGELAPVSVRLRERALPHMLRLYEASGENVHLAVLSSEDPAAAEALYVARVTGPHSIPTLSRMGGRHPLHTTGVGKALLAQRDDEWLDVFFQRTLERETVHSITDERQLREEIRFARSRGFSTTRQEMTLGNVSVAASLPRVWGLPPTAVGVVTHLARADERRLGALVSAAARDIAKDLAAP